MSYLLDSTWVVGHLNDEAAAVQLVESLAPSGIASSIITYMEAFQGTLRRHQPVSPDRFEAFFNSVPVLPLSPSIARRCAGLREQLKRDGKQPNRRALDLIIAATAIEHGLVLVTANVRDFADIPGLTLY